MLESSGERLRAEISSIYTNATGETVHIVNCEGAFGVSLEKRVGGKWVRAWSNVVPLCLSSPIVVEPGRTHEHTLRVSAGRSSSNLHPRFEVEEVAGTYRMVWSGPVHPDGEGGAKLPAEKRISNAFVLEPR